jgi:S-DNA-T family DNA segregation ATPase FtsK/SpoIIIE
MAASKKKGNRNSRKASSGRKQQKRGSRQEMNTDGIRSEVILCIVLALSVLLLVSNFHLGGAAGNAISSVAFGLFGVMSYVLPFILFFGFAFYVANRDNYLIRRKMTGLVLLLVFLCAFVQLLFTGFDRSISIGRYYTMAADEHTGGGIIGGILVFLFGFAFSTVGAYILTIAGLVIGAVVMTQKPLVSELHIKSRDAVRSAHEKHREVREERMRMAEEERREEAEEREKLEKRNAKMNIPVVGEKISDTRADAPQKDASGKMPLPVKTEVQAKEAVPSPEELSASLKSAVRKAVQAEKPKQENAQDEIPGYSENDKTKAAETAHGAENASGNAAGNAAGNSAGNAPESGKKHSTDEEIRDGVNTIRSEIGEAAKPAPVFRLPTTDMLTKGKAVRGDSEQHLMDTAQKLQQTFHDFGVNVRVTDVSRGPTVTRYELQPEHGVKVSRILSLSDDIKLNLATADIRIEAPIPGKAAVGIEVPNKENSSVMLRDMLESEEYRNFRKPLAFAVGKDIAGKPVVTDIAKMPHLLIAGATGSGKSVCINTLIMSILYKAKPDQVRMLMIDPKVVELKMYNGIPHLLIPVVTDPKKAAGALNWAVAEMTDRYNKFAEYNGVRDIDSYNERIEKINADPAVTEKIPKMPLIVIIVDELADLMMVSPGEVEDAICRLAQLARAAGLHLIIATQRPSVNVVTGLIKANMPSRIALSVTSGVDSRTILDMNGAEKLLGKGDMLFYPQGYSKPARVQGAFVSDDDIARVVKFLSSQAGDVVYNESVEEKITESMNSSPDVPGASSDDRDEYFWEAGALIIDKDKASIGMLQRVFKIGFNRAARIMDQLCDSGVVSEEDGTKPRNILMTQEQFENMKEQE